MESEKIMKVIIKVQIEISAEYDDESNNKFLLLKSIKEKLRGEMSVTSGGYFWKLTNKNPKIIEIIKR